MESKTSERIVWIDWAKSICMFLVILGHCHICDEEQFVVQYIYSFHMPLFFFLSGMLCKRSMSLKAIKKDLKYLVLPYFSYGILYIIVDVICLRSVDLMVVLSRVKSLLFGLDVGVGPIWFLIAIFISKQLFLFAEQIKTYSSVFFLFLSLLSFIPAYYFSTYHYNLPLFMDSALLGLPYLIIGFEIQWIWKVIIQKNAYLRLGVSVLCGMLSVYMCYKNGKVVVADCIIGNSVLLYYTNAFFSIFSFMLLCTLLDCFRWRFILISSYGTIVTLGIHGVILTVFNYYLPIILGCELLSYNIIIALCYSLLTYALCYMLIIFLDTGWPMVFGLKGKCRQYL